jgi:CheY-like chemotaxis protein
MKQAKILIVDDSQLMHAMYDTALSRLIRQNGLQLIHCDNGLQAVVALEQNTGIALVLLDLYMQEMSGLDFLRYRRLEQLRTDIPVVVVTQEGRREVLSQAFAEGAMLAVTKPFQGIDLCSVLQHILGMSQRNSHEVAVAI